MILKVKGKYVTKCGNQVECVHIDENEKVAICKYIKIAAEGHESLKTKPDLWRLDGQWKKKASDHCIHDIVGEA